MIYRIFYFELKSLIEWYGQFKWVVLARVLALNESVFY